MRKELRITGFGGQGVITIGVLMAKALGQFDSYYVAQTQSYGPEARGGACKTDLITSDREIDYIKPTRLDVLACMSQPSLDAYAHSLDSSNLLLIDSTLVQNVPDHFQNVSSIQATSLAEDRLGMRVVASVVMLGALAKTTGWVTPEACKRALADTMPEKVLDRNYEAFDLGYFQVTREK